MNVLNDAFKSTGVQFSLIDTTRTVNADWFEKTGPGTSQEIAMKSAFRSRNEDKDLHVYTVG